MASSFFDDPALLAPPRTVQVRFDGGAFVLRSPEPLKPYARCIGEWLEHWAQATPDALFLAERDAAGALAQAELRAGCARPWARSRRACSACTCRRGGRWSCCPTTRSTTRC